MATDASGQVERGGRYWRRSVRLTSALVLTVAVVAIGLTATVLGASSRRTQLHEEYEARYGRARAEAVGDLVAGVERYATVLRSTSAFVSSSDDVTQGAFDRYGRALDLAERYPGIERVGYVRLVPPAPSGPPRPQAVVVLATGGSDGIGTDLTVDPLRREALDRARDTGEVAMTAPVLRFDDADLPEAQRPLVVALYAPVYASDKPPLTVETRRASLSGWTASVFRLDELSRNLGIGADLVQLDLRVAGGPAAGAIDDSPLAELPRSRVETVDLLGRRWNVVFAPTPALGAPSDDWHAVLWGGAGTTLGLAAIVSLLATQRSRLRREVTAAVAEANAVNARLERETDFQRALLANLQVGVIVVDHRGRLRSYNLDSEGFYSGRLSTTYDGSWSELLGLHTLDGELLPDEQNPMLRVLAGERVRGIELLVRPDDGPEHIVSCNGQPIVDADGNISGAVVVVHDITALKEAQGRLEQLARHDPLTGLANRALLTQRLDEAFARSARRGTDVALLFLDLDGFKPVNDGYGHDVGDEVLRAVAGRLLLTCRLTDTVARLGGDEFVVLCEDLPEQATLDALVARFQHALDAPYYLERTNATVTLGVSIGVARAAAGEEPASLLRRADDDMYRTKAGRREFRSASRDSSRHRPGE
jgi:diguanylate cyclase (GGDEF)-like protein